MGVAAEMPCVSLGHALTDGPCGQAVGSILKRSFPKTSLPEFMNFKLLGKTFLVVSIRWFFLGGHTLSKCS